MDEDKKDRTENSSEKDEKIETSVENHLEEKNDNEEKDKSMKKQERQVMWVLFTMVAIIVMVFVIAFSVDETKKFDYIGLEWKKEMFGDMPIYTSKINLIDSYGKDINFKFNIRNDPRKLKVPLEGEMNIIPNQPVYFAINFTQEAKKCSTAPLVNFGMFATGMRYNLLSVVAEKKDSDIYGQEYVNCENKEGYTVFIYTNGDETEIKQSETNPNCYILTYNECENTELLESLQLEIISMTTGERRELTSSIFD